MNETWKTIPDWPSYEASSLGRVRKTTTQRVLKPFTSSRGYKRVSLYRDGQKSIQGVAKMVALTFIGPRPAGLQINHIDGVKANNRPENLEYCTSAENNRHAFRLGLNHRGANHGSCKHPELRAVGSRQGSSKLTEEQVIEIRRKYRTGQVGYKRLACEYGVSPRTVVFIVKRQAWRHV